MTVEDLPAVNAALNGVAAVFLFLGWRAIKAKRRDVHARYMVCALVASTAFLSSYLVYHYHTGSTAYEGEGFWRIVYFTILVTHVPLAGLMVPFILAAVWFAYRKRFDIHTRITKVLWPVWMYVSVTGVLIYAMLYVF